MNTTNDRKSTFWHDGYRDAKNGFKPYLPRPTLNVFEQEYLEGYKAYQDDTRRTEDNPS